MIAQILHQTWKSKDELPEDFRFWRESFFEFNAGLDYRIYDDADNRALVGEMAPKLIPFYDSFPREIFRADFIRPFYLFRHGGHYADMDFQCLAPLAKIGVDGPGVILGRMGTNDRFLHSIPNAFMASTPNQGFWLGYLANMRKTWLARRGLPRIHTRPDYVTGPVVLRQTVSQYRNQPTAFRARVEDFIRDAGFAVDPGKLHFGPLTLLPGHILYPLNWKDQIHRVFLKRRAQEHKVFTVEQAKSLFPVSVAVTYWAHSWDIPDPEHDGDLVEA